MRGFGSTRGALAALAFACAASVWLHLTGERAISGLSAVLGSPAYDMQSVVAPAASGPLLTALTYLLTATPLGPPIRRFLLNDNKVEILRELAAQSNNTPQPGYTPGKMIGNWQVYQDSEITGDERCRNIFKVSLSLPQAKFAFINSQSLDQLTVGQAKDTDAMTTLEFDEFKAWWEAEIV